MNSKVEAFCLVAVGKGVMSTDQYAIFEEVCSEDTEITEATELLIDCGLITNRETLVELIQEADVVELRDELEAAEQEEAAAAAPIAAEDAGSKVPVAVEWFCYHAVNEKLLEKDVCVCLYTCLEGVSDLLGFAQSLVTTRMCEDFAKVQELVERSRQDAKDGSPPPFSVFAA